MQNSKLPEDKTISFEHAFRELEQIVSEFERGGVDLEGGIELFKRALVLAGVCKKRLQEAENQIITIKEQFGELSEQHNG